MVVNKIDSNVTGLRYAEEASLKVLPGSPTWYPLEPNDYEDFGGETTTVARTPITQGRQRRKGVVVDLDASGGFSTDVTLENLEDLGQGFFFASLRRKGEGITADVDGATEMYNLDHATGMYVGSLVFGEGHDNAANNGLKRVTAVVSVQADGTLTLTGNAVNNETVTIGTTVYTWKTTLTGAAYEVLIGGSASDSLDNLIAAINGAAGEGTTYGTDTEAHTLVTAAAGAGDTMDLTAILDGPGGNSIATTETMTNGSFGAVTLENGDASITVAEDLITETPTGTATVVVVGFQFTTTDASIDVSGSLPALDSVAKDMTEFGVIPGEFVFLGGDSAASTWANTENTGFCRLRSVAANTITFDKTAFTMVTDAGTGKTIQIFFGRVLKNEVDTLIHRRTYQLERTLGAPDESEPTEVQAEYLEGAVPGGLTVTAAVASKLDASMTFVALDHTQRTSVQGLKSGSRPALTSGAALNTSSNITKIKLAVVTPGDANPSALFGYATDLTLEIDNNLTPNKALGVLGGFEVTAGDFGVTGTMEAYFSDVAAVAAVRQNSDVTLEVHYTKDNGGITMDVPLIALGDARLDVVKDEPIKIPLTTDAATGFDVHEDLNHTLLFVFWDYLPDAAS